MTSFYLSFWDDLYVQQLWGGAGIYPPSQTVPYIQTDSDILCCSKRSITLLYDHHMLTSEAFAHYNW